MQEAASLGWDVTTPLHKWSEENKACWLCEEERIASLKIAVSELRSPIVPIDDPDDEFLAKLKEICDNVELARQKGFATEIFLSRKAYLNMPLPSSLEKQ
jgi:hypothetical protein